MYIPDRTEEEDALCVVAVGLTPTAGVAEIDAG